MSEMSYVQKENLFIKNISERVSKPRNRDGTYVTASCNYDYQSEEIIGGDRMKRRKIFFIIFTVVILMIFLFGCGKQKYKLNFDGYGFESKKSEYASGEKVTVYFKFIGTDMDYNFYTDDESIKLEQSYDLEDGYILTFIMPDHDVTLKLDSHNNMEYFL